MARRAALLIVATASAFLGAPPQPVVPPAVPPAVGSRACETDARSRTRRAGALDDLAATAQDLLSKLSPAPAAYNASNVKPGNIVRCGAKAQNQSRVKGWTTNKPSVPGFVISSTGCGNDYNFYRTTKIRGDNERAVSILTTDVLGALNGEGWPVRVGDLGENLFVDGMRYDVFAIGRRDAALVDLSTCGCRGHDAFTPSDAGRFLFGKTAILEITEPIAPCAYLCTLPYLTPKWRCADFIRTLDRRRGWYAKVVATGPVAVGDAVVAL